jgi:hypothetical protein
MHWVSNDPKSPDCYKWKYILTDSDFGKTVGISTAPMPAPIIIEYSKRSLNVEANLVLYFLEMQRKYDEPLKIQLLVLNQSTNEEFIKLWKTVDQDKIDKWLVWS